jgi:hypothetical protein
MGCGEEALTLWAFTNRMQAFLLQLRDPSLVEDVTVLLRPTFGRARMAGPRSVRSEIGRFDAIVTTGGAIYLVDTRWHRSEDVADEPMFLGQTQRRRHRAFREYLSQWRDRGPSDWRDFEAALTPAFEEKDLGVRPAPAGSHLARNLEFVLRRCSEADLPVEDVLLLVVPRGWARMPRPPDGYRLVLLEYEPIDGSDYVVLNPPGRP